MGLLKFAERFFPKTYIGIWNNNDMYNIAIRYIYPSGKIENELQIFDADVETQKMFDFLEEIQQKNIVTYIAILDQSIFQGALPVEGKVKLLEFDEIKNRDDFNDIFFREMNGWTLYTSHSELLKIQNKFSNTGIDYIFSPFLIPISARETFNLSKNTSIFILAEKNLILFSIFKGNKLLYGEIVKDIDINELVIDEVKSILEETEDKNEEIITQHISPKIEKVAKHQNQAHSAFFDEGSIELDLLDSDLEKAMHEDDEKLHDELLKLDFKELQDEKPIKQEKKINTIELEKMLSDGLEEEIKIEEERLHEGEVNHKLLYFTIQNGVNKFYNDKVFSSDFIENCYILTSLKIDGNFLSKIETEFSFETEKIKIDIAEKIIQLIGEEIENKI